MRHDKIKIIDDIEPFNDLFYRYCLNSSFFPILNTRNGSCLSFLVNDVQIYRSCVNQGIPKLEVQYCSSLSFEQLLENQGIGCNKKGIIDNIVSETIQDIDSGKPVIIWVDSYYERFRNDTYLKDHLSHTWLIYGYNEIDRTSNIIEHKYRNSLTYEKRMVNYTDLCNCYDGYITLNKQACGFPRFYECQDECGYLHSNDYFKSCGFPKLTNFENKYDIASYISFDITNKHNNENNNKQWIELYKSNIDKNFESILYGLNHLKRYFSQLEQVFISEELLRKSSLEIMNDFNNIVNSKLADKFKNIHLFGEHSQLHLKAEHLVNIYSNIRSIITKFVFSQIYDKQKIERMITIMKDIHQIELDYYLTFHGS